MAKVTFDGANKLIIATSGTVSIDVKTELYSVWKNFVTSSDNSKYLPAFRVLGGDPLGAGLNAGSYFFLQNQDGWRIRPQEANHELTLKGNLYAEDASLPMFVPTTGSYTVSIALERSSLTQVVQTANTASLTADDVANAVWDEVIPPVHTGSNSAGYFLYNAGGGSSPETIASAVWNTSITNHTGSNTFGEKVGKKLLTLAKFLGLK